MRKKNSLNFVITALGLTGLGIVLGVAGGYIGAHTANPSGFEALGVAIFGLLVGYVLGAIAGLFLLKYAVRVPGSLILGILAAAVWTVVSIGVANLMNHYHDASSAIVVIVFLLIPTASLTGFYLKRTATS